MAPTSSNNLEGAAKAIYELDPCFEPGEFVDGFPVSPGGNLSWEQAKARDAEFAPDYLLPITKFAFDAAEVAMVQAREIVARWIMERGYATGHGDTIEDLLAELEAQARELGQKRTG